jgi:hypothetical protein
MANFTAIQLRRLIAITDWRRCLLLGVKRTSLTVSPTSAFDPKRTFSPRQEAAKESENACSSENDRPSNAGACSTA